MSTGAGARFCHRFFARRCPQQKIFQSKFAVAGSKRPTADATGDILIGGRFRSRFDADNLIKRVAVDLEPDHFAGTQSAAVGKTEQHACPQTVGNGQ